MPPDRPNMNPHIAEGEVVNAPPPPAAHIIHDYDTESDDEFETIELRTLGDGRARGISRVITPGRPMVHWYDPIRRVWRHRIRISVPFVDCRDHLANERTFLGYLRTSVALSMIGIFIAQLYRLQHREHPDKVFGYFVLSKPLSGIFQVTALLMVVVGSIRFWRQQHAMSVGKVHAGGWELYGAGIASLLLLTMMFAVHLALDIYKQNEDGPMSM